MNEDQTTTAADAVASIQQMLAEWNNLLDENRRLVVRLAAHAAAAKAREAAVSNAYRAAAHDSFHALETAEAAIEVMRLREQYEAARDADSDAELIAALHHALQTAYAAFADKMRILEATTRH